MSPTVISPKISLKISASIGSVYNVLTDLVILSSYEAELGFGRDWALQIDSQLSSKTKEDNLLVTRFLFHYLDALVQSQSWPDFPSFLAALSTKEATELRDKGLEILSEQTKQDHDRNVLPKQILEDIEAFAQCFPEGQSSDTQLQKAHALISQAEELRSFCVSHLTYMWESHLRGEWETAFPLIEAAVNRFNGSEYADLTIVDAIYQITGREARIKPSADITDLILVPSTHVGPFLLFWYEGLSKLYLVCSATLLSQERPSKQAFSRAQLLFMLNALADELRLSMLIHIKNHPGTSTQQLLEHFKLTKSTGSRHLNVLRGAGFLIEERGTGANKLYRLDDTLLSRFMASLSQTITD